jgi:beta-lactamase class A
MNHVFKAAALALALAVSCAPPSKFEKMSRLERDIRLAANRHSPGLRISLWLAQADGREILALDPDRPVPGASTLKVLILVEAHAQAIQGTFRWADDYTMLETDVVGGTGSFQRERIGSSWSYLQYARRMISESDNTAANILLRRVGMTSVNERAARLGLQVTRFEREFMDFQALDAGKDNWTTAREMGQLFRAIFRREILTPEACDEMIRLLERTSRGRIAAGVPPEIAVGHKSGYFPGLRHDAGWVRVPGHPYILSVFLENVGKDEGGIAALDAIGRIVYDAIGPTDE